MNAASGIVSFPQDKIEVVSFSKTGSIISLWVQEPSFSNSAGTINFEGIVLNPGFTGTAGKILNVTFRPKTTGTANLNFYSGSVLANDGQGTNILTSMSKASFGLGGAVSTAPETTTPSEAAGIPAAPQISSPTHPDQEKWYSNNNPKFVWQVPQDVTSVRLLYGRYPDSQPQVVYSPAISEKQLKNLRDGIYYFHAQFKNKNGWGKIAHFRFQIDTQPPEPFEIKFIENKESKPILVFNAVDSLSGIDDYKIEIGENTFLYVPQEAAAIESGDSYTLPSQLSSGRYTVIVQAFDKARNYTSASKEITISESQVVEKENLPFERTLAKITSVAILITIFVAVLALLFALVILDGNEAN